jgi:hypothetical protein
MLIKRIIFFPLQRRLIANFIRKSKVSLAILTNQTGAPIGNLNLLRAIADSFKN